MERKTARQAAFKIDTAGDLNPNWDERTFNGGKRKTTKENEKHQRIAVDHRKLLALIALP